MGDMKTYEPRFDGNVIEGLLGHLRELIGDRSEDKRQPTDLVSLNVPFGFLSDLYSALREKQRDLTYINEERIQRNTSVATLAKSLAIAAAGNPGVDSSFLHSLHAWARIQAEQIIRDDMPATTHMVSVRDLSPENTEAFQAELQALVAKYGGT